MSQSYSQCREIEIDGLKAIVNFIRLKSFEGRYVLTDKGPLSPQLQKEFGDVFAEIGTSESNRCLHAIECKTEVTFTGNFFLEIWSNLKHGMQTPGWMVSLRCGYLMYYFQDTKLLYSINFPKLFHWFWGERGNERFLIGQIHSFESVNGKRRVLAQTKTEQKNITVGFIMPIDDVFNARVPIKEYRLLDDGNYQLVRDSLSAIKPVELPKYELPKTGGLFDQLKW